MLPRQSEADEFVELRLKPAVLAERRLPDGAYPIRRETLESLIASGGDVQIHDMLRGLMDWLDVTDEPEQATDMIRQILRMHFPDDGEREASCTFQSEDGHLHRFLIGEVDANKPLVAWQRCDWLMMIGTPSVVEPGRLLVAAPRPMSCNAAQSIVRLSTTTWMGGILDSYAAALMISGGTPDITSQARGQLELVGWEHGLGANMIDGKLHHAPNLLPDHEWLAPNQVAILVAIGADYA